MTHINEVMVGQPAKDDKKGFLYRTFAEVPLREFFIPVNPRSQESGKYYVFNKVSESRGTCPHVKGRYFDFLPDDLVIQVVDE